MQDITLSLNFNTHLNNVGQLIHVIDKFDKIYLLIAMLSYIYIYIYSVTNRFKKLILVK